LHAYRLQNPGENTGVFSRLLESKFVTWQPFFTYLKLTEPSAASEQKSAKESIDRVNNICKTADGKYCLLLN
jgi:hypothetical protein